MGRLKLRGERRPHPTENIKYKDVAVVKGDWAGIGQTGLLAKLYEHGCLPLFCCGAGREQLIGAFHPEKANPGETITCPRCGIVHTCRDLPAPDPYLDGATRAFLRPDGTYAQAVLEPPN